jgi:glyoxylase-like metal-dependent hydrolase (beta-lactamase superfamily II)
MSRSTSLSRRHFLKGLGLGAAAVSASGIQWLGVNKVFAQTSPASGTITALARVAVGEFEVTILQDAVFPFDPTIFAANATPDEIVAVLEANNMPTDAVTTTVNVMLVNTGDQLILLDTGNGAGAGGRLLPTLELAGVTPDQINAVVISHFHPDHINGLSAEGALVFPNATVYFPQAEWDFMQSAGDDSPAAQTVQAARAQLQPAIDSGQIVYYAPEGEIIPGIEAVPTPGHTPGHSALRIVSGEAALLNIVDAALNPVISLARPDWTPGFDAIPEQAAETRAALLARAAEEGLHIFGYHFPFPGLGYVIADGDGYRFVPVV